MVGGNERWLYRAFVLAVCPVAFASYVNGKMQRYYPYSQEIPAHLQNNAGARKWEKSAACKLNLTQALAVDVPKAWFTSKTDREQEFANVLLNQVLVHRAEAMWLSIWSALGLPRFKRLETECEHAVGEKYAIVRDGDKESLALRFESIPGWIRHSKFLAGEHMIRVEDLDRQTCRIWIVSHLAMPGALQQVDGIEVREDLAKPHALLGDWPVLLDANKKEEIPSAWRNELDIYLYRAFWRIAVDGALTRMMRKRPLILFFEE